MARSDPQLNFRIPAELRDKLEAAAQANKRSLTGELIARLEATFDETVVTTVEAKVRPGSEEKRFEFNADEIADKVVQRLELMAREKTSEERVIIPKQSDLEQRMKETYLQYAAAVLRQGVPELKPPRGNDPYGPKKSPNSRKPNP